MLTKKIEFHLLHIKKLKKFQNLNSKFVIKMKHITTTITGVHFTYKQLGATKHESNFTLRNPCSANV